MNKSTAFPDMLCDLLQLNVSYSDSEIDFEPYQAFMSPSETNEWLQSWTGNPNADGTPFRVFGQDGTGGYAAFWVVREDASVLEQPIVFLGSEGDISVVSRNFQDYLWLLASSIGPMEATEYGAEDARENPLFLDFARTHAPGAERPPAEILESARAEFPDFADIIEQLCE